MAAWTTTQLPPQWLRLLAEFGLSLTPRATTSYLDDALTSCCGPLVVQFLVQAGADLTFRNGCNWACLFRASGADVARMLIAAGADVHATDNGQRAPLHAAMSWVAGDKSAVAAALLEAGAHVNVLECSGRTPLRALMDDAGPNDAAALDFLARHGADPTVPLRDGRTPLETVIRHLGFLTANGGNIWNSNDTYARRLRLCVRPVRVLRAATAWWRRRHLLTAICGRASSAVVVAGTGSGGEGPGDSGEAAATDGSSSLIGRGIGCGWWACRGWGGHGCGRRWRAVLMAASRQSTCQKQQ